MANMEANIFSWEIAIDESWASRESILTFIRGRTAGRLTRWRYSIPSLDNQTTWRRPFKQPIGFARIACFPAVDSDMTRLTRRDLIWGTRWPWVVHFWRSTRVPAIGFGSRKLPAPSTSFQQISEVR